ncbi:MAG TPA: multidrug effflux MFS transporter [Woeseiaceae bacterium]|nr:multidrug effflux MFS transporter [Woeseiaceae bacterium]
MNPELVHQRSFVVTLGLLTATAALTVDISLPAIPAMVEALATNLSHGQQIVGIFLFGMALGQIPAGLLSDRMGRMPVLYTGMGIFALAAWVAAAANSIEVMLVSRFVQGFGAAAAIVLSRSIVRDVATGMEAARLMSLMTMIFTAAPVIAPSIGAFLTTHWGWRTPFVTIAFCALLLLVAIRQNLGETHRPNVDGHPLRQLLNSFREFFSHRQSIFGLLLLVLPPAGFMSIIAVSSALAIERYGFSVQAYGLVFACAGLSILAGSFLNRMLVLRYSQLGIMGAGIAIMGLAGAQLLFMAFMNEAPFAWLWSCVCAFMFTIALVMPNATVLALDPMPRIAGVASSIIGTLQNLTGAAGALVGAAIYDGSVRNAVVLIGGIAVTVTAIFLSRRWIAPGPFVHDPRELARP